MGKIYTSHLTYTPFFPMWNSRNTGSYSFMELKKIKTVHKSEVAKWQPTAAFNLQAHPNFLL